MAPGTPKAGIAVPTDPARIARNLIEAAKPTSTPKNKYKQPRSGDLEEETSYEILAAWKEAWPRRKKPWGGAGNLAKVPPQSVPVLIRHFIADLVVRLQPKFPMVPFKPKTGIAARMRNNHNSHTAMRSSLIRKRFTYRGESSLKSRQGP